MAQRVKMLAADPQHPHSGKREPTTLSHRVSAKMRWISKCMSNGQDNAQPVVKGSIWYLAIVTALLFLSSFSCGLGLSSNSLYNKDDLAFLILLPLPPECLCVPHDWFYVVLGIEPSASCMLGNHLTNSATLPVLDCSLTKVPDFHLFILNSP